MGDQLKKAKPLILLLGLFVAMEGQYCLGQRNLTAGLLLYACSLPLALYGMLGGDKLPPQSQRVVLPAQTGWRRAGLILCIVALATQLALMALQISGILGSRQTWIGYFVCWGLCAIGLGIYAVRWAELGASLRRQRYELLILLVILILAGVLRVYNLENVPVGLWGDEGNDGMETLAVLDGKIPSPFVLDWGGTNGVLRQWVTALFFLVFGPNTFALRLVAAAAGVVSIFATYLLAREIGGARLGLVAAFLLTVSRWHLSRSRFDSLKVQGLPFEILAFLFLLRALRTRRLLDFVLCGVATGLALNFYIGLRIVPIIVVVVLAVEFMKRPAAFLRQNWLGCAGALLGLLLTFGPLAAHYAGDPQDFIGRPNFVLIFNNARHFQSGNPDIEPTKWNMLKVQGVATALMFNYVGDANNVFNWIRKPMLDPLTGMLFVLGVAYCVWRWRDRRYFLLASALILTMVFGSVLTVGAPESQRTVGVTPVLAILAALAGARAWTALSAGRRRWWRPALVCVAGVWLAATAYSNIELFFGRQMPSRETWGSRASDVTILSRYIRDHADGYRYYFQATESLNQGTSILRFVAGKFDGEDFSAPALVLPAFKPADKGLVYVIQANQEALVQLAQRTYPDGRLTSLKDPWGRVMYWLYQVEASELAAHQGVTGRYYAGPEWQGEPLLTRTDRRLDFKWPQDAPAPGPFSAEWQGVLMGTGGARLVGLSTESPAELWVDGEKLSGAKPGEPALVNLPYGLHTVRVRAAFPAGGAPLTLLWGQSRLKMTPVPAEALGVWPAAPGLLGAYYGNTEWSGSPALYQMDSLMSFLFTPTTDLLRRPFSVEWRGSLRIDAAGSYEFATRAQNVSQIWIDEQLVLENTSGNADKPVSQSVALTAGEHALRIRYTYAGGWRSLDIYMTPPGGERQVLPADWLTPAQPEPATEAMLAQGLGTGVGSASETAPLQFIGAWGEPGNGLGQLSSPLKTALLPDGRLAVADRGNRRIAIFDAQGRGVASWGEPDLVEPTDIEVAASGEVYVLDSGRGTVEVFDAAGKHLRSMGKDWSMYAPRGLAVGRDGTLYVAATGSNQLLIAPAGGAPAKRIGAPGNGPGQFQQPVDVVLDGAGNVYVLDTMTNKRVQQLDAQGEWFGEWLLEWAPNSGAPGIAYDAADDTFYLTDVNRSWLLQYAPDGSPIDKWNGEQLGIVGQFRPVSVTVDSAAGRLYVVDSGRQQILVFSKKDLAE